MFKFSQKIFSDFNDLIYELFSSTVTQQTNIAQKPDRPDFSWKIIFENSKPKLILHWISNTTNNPGSFFYAKYKLDTENVWEITEPEFSSNNLCVTRYK